MKYIFIDTDNGGTPANATPDTSTSKYHTTGSLSTFPAAGGCWSSLETARSDATIAALTDDITFYCRGAADDARWSMSGMSAASILVQGNATGAVWDASKYTNYYNGTGNTAFVARQSGTVALTVKHIQLDGEQGSTATSPCGFEHSAAGSLTLDGVKIRLRGSNTASGSGIRGAGSHGTTVVENCIVDISGQTAASGGNGFTSQTTPTTSAYNSVIRGSNRGTSSGTSNVDTVINCVVFNNASTDISGGTKTYNATDDITTGTGNINGLVWADQFVDYTNFDYRLKSGSSLIGAGIGPSSDADVPTPDIAGVTRSGTTTDIGAAMFVPSGLTITSIVPAQIDSGESFTIAGSGFGATQGLSLVQIGGVTQTPTSWSDSSITCTATRGSQSMGNATLTIYKM